MKKRKPELPVQSIVLLAIILLAFAFIMGYIWKVLTTADFFSVKTVYVRNSDSQFEYLKGRNILSLNLKYEARKAFLSCPDCRKVRFARILPDTIVVDFLKRKAVALVRFYKNFAVDDQGVLFLTGQEQEEAGLPVIYGLETKIFAPRLGFSYKRSELGLALNIINELKLSKAFSGFSLKMIDVANPGNARFFLLLPKQAANYALAGAQGEWRGFEVRIGASNIRQKMMILGGLVLQEHKEWANINYIDLRFKEPLIKLNNVK